MRNFAVTTQIGQCKPIKLQVDNQSGRPGKMRELELGQGRVNVCEIGARSGKCIGPGKLRYTTFSILTSLMFIDAQLSVT